MLDELMCQELLPITIGDGAGVAAAAELGASIRHDDEKLPDRAGSDQAICAPPQVKPAQVATSKPDARLGGETVQKIEDWITANRGLIVARWKIDQHPLVDGSPSRLPARALDRTLSRTTRPTWPKAGVAATMIANALTAMVPITFLAPRLVVALAVRLTVPLIATGELRRSGAQLVARPAAASVG